MRDWFESLEIRERLFVTAGAIVVGIALLYAFAWVPLDKRHSEVETSVGNWQRSLAELRPLKNVQRAAAVPRPGAGAQQSAIIIVDQTLRSRGLEQYRQRSQPTSTNGIRVEFEDVAFDDLVLWLGDLADQYGMHVQAASVTSGTRSGPGRVNASVTLERAR